jgi:hypothetical protein
MLSVAVQAASKSACRRRQPCRPLGLQDPKAPCSQVFGLEQPQSGRVGWYCALPSPEPWRRVRPCHMRSPRGTQQSLNWRGIDVVFRCSRWCHKSSTSTRATGSSRSGQRQTRSTRWGARMMRSWHHRSASIAVRRSRPRGRARRGARGSAGVDRRSGPVTIGHGFHESTTVVDSGVLAGRGHHLSPSS